MKRSDSRRPPSAKPKAGPAVPVVVASRYPLGASTGATAGAEAASDRMCIATDGAKALPISAQDVCFNSNLNGCNGGQITTPWTYIRWRGAVSGGQYNNTGPFGNMGLCSNWGFAHCHHHGPQRDDPYPDEGAEGCKSDKSPPGPTKCDNTAKGSHADFKGDKYKRGPSVAAFLRRRRDNRYAGFTAQQRRRRARKKFKG